MPGVLQFVILPFMELSLKTLSLRTEDHFAVVKILSDEETFACGQFVEDLFTLSNIIQSAEKICIVLFTGNFEFFKNAQICAQDLQWLRKWEQALHKIEEINKIFIAAIDGKCSQQGIDFVMSCDLRVSTERSEIILNGQEGGKHYSGMQVYRVAREIGLGRLRKLYFFGHRLSAKQAYEEHLLQHVFTGNQESFSSQIISYLKNYIQEDYQKFFYNKKIMHMSYDLEWFDVFNQNLTFQKEINQDYKK